MKPHRFPALSPALGLAVGLILLIFSACGTGGGGTAVFVGESDPAEFRLDFQKPEIFKFNIEKAGTYRFALETTYFSEQLQGWDHIPVYFILVKSDKKEMEKEVEIPLKENGEWRGKVLENETDRIFEATLAEGIELPAGEQEFRLYGNTTSEKPIMGMVHLAFKVYK